MCTAGVYRGCSVYTGGVYRGCSACIEVSIGAAVYRGCSMRGLGVAQVAGKAGAVWGGGHLGAAPGKEGARVRGHVQGRGPTCGGKGQKDPRGCSQPCTDTAQYCSKGHLRVPHPTLVDQLGPTAQPPRPWGSPTAFRVGGASPLQRGAGGSVAVRGGWEQWALGWHRVRLALGAPSTGCRGGRGPAGEQDAWGARARGLGQTQGWGLRSPVPQHPSWESWDQHPGGLQPPHHLWCLPWPSCPHPCGAAHGVAQDCLAGSPAC